MATVPIRPLAWEPPYAVGVATKRQTTTKRETPVQPWGSSSINTHDGILKPFSRAKAATRLEDHDLRQSPGFLEPRRVTSPPANQKKATCPASLLHLPIKTTLPPTGEFRAFEHEPPLPLPQTPTWFFFVWPHCALGMRTSFENPLTIFL